MSDWLRENRTNIKIASKNVALLIGLWFGSFFFLACDNGDERDGVRDRPGNFPPVVFLADKDTDDTGELYASFDDGTVIIKLSGPLVFGGNVVDFSVSPNGFWVAYVADQDTDELFELYVVPVDKLPNEFAVKVSVPLAGRGLRETATGCGEFFFAWAPDSSRVAYVADAADFGFGVEIADRFELFSSTPNGIRKDLISDLDDPDSDVEDFEWEPDSTLIAYVADQDTLGQFELYVSPSDRNNPNSKVSGTPMVGSGIKGESAGCGNYSFGWAPDSSRLAYIADQLALGKFELFTSLPDGGDNLLVSELPNNTRDVVNFQWAPNSERIAYTANQDIAGAFDLFTTRPNVSTTSLQNSSGLSDGRVVSIFAWAPDSSRIAFLSDKVLAGVFQLYSVQPANSNDVLISGGLANTSDVIKFEWAPDASLIAYRVDAQNFELYTTLPDRRSSTQIQKPPVLGGGGDVFEFEWAPNSARLAYTANFDQATVIELFSSTPDNRITDQVSGSLVANGDVGEFKWAPDSSGVGYIADQNTDGVDELYASKPNGADNAKLSGDLVTGGDVSEFEWVP